jgi:hypothetical protein
MHQALRLLANAFPVLRSHELRPLSCACLTSERLVAKPAGMLAASLGVRHPLATGRSPAASRMKLAQLRTSRVACLIDAASRLMPAWPCPNYARALLERLSYRGLSWLRADTNTLWAACLLFAIYVLEQRMMRVAESSFC